MRNMTNDMTRLRGEIDTLRNDRRALKRALSRSAKELATTVSDMRDGFNADHTAMAKQSRGEREAFVAQIGRDVSNMLKETADDLLGARLVWRNQSVRKPLLVQVKREPLIVTHQLPVEEAAIDTDEALAFEVEMPVEEAAISADEAFVSEWERSSVEEAAMNTEEAFVSEWERSPVEEAEKNSDDEAENSVTFTQPMMEEVKPASQQKQSRHGKTKGKSL